jgi:hypothetical protein
MDEKYIGGFLRIREELLKKYGSSGVIRSKQFVHSGLIYKFSLHSWKLNEFCEYEGLKKYLLGLDTWVNKYFSSGKRGSQLKTVKDVKIT